jgi:hypothetical protein
MFIEDNQVNYEINEIEIGDTFRFFKDTLKIVEVKEAGWVYEHNRVGSGFIHFKNGRIVLSASWIKQNKTKVDIFISDLL